MTREGVRQCLDNKEVTRRQESSRGDSQNKYHDVQNRKKMENEVFYVQKRTWVFREGRREKHDDRITNKLTEQLISGPVIATRNSIDKD